MSPMDVEVLAANWRKAGRSVGNGACVEVASASAHVLVRDSVAPSGAAIAYAPEAWHAFIGSVKSGAFGLPR
jgi:hypothetical protein